MHGRKVGGDVHLTLPARLADAIAKRDLKEVWVGFRPEHLHLLRTGQSLPQNVIEGTVDVVEPQGSNTLVQVAVTEKLRLNALVDPLFEPSPGDRVRLGLGEEAIHVFDPATDESLG